MNQEKFRGRMGAGNEQNALDGAESQENPAREDQNAQQGDAEMFKSFEEIAKSIVALSKEGKLPEGFDLEAACRDRAFVDLIIDYSAEAAVRIYDAEKRLAEAESGAKQRVENDVRARNALPKSARANISANPTPDYKRMSAEEFRRLEQQYKRAARNGKNVNL